MNNQVVYNIHLNIHESHRYKINIVRLIMNSYYLVPMYFNMLDIIMMDMNLYHFLTHQLYYYYNLHL